LSNEFLILAKKIIFWFHFSPGQAITSKSLLRMGLQSAFFLQFPHPKQFIAPIRTISFYSKAIKVVKEQALKN
jgi:hypothetical protein